MVEGSISGLRLIVLFHVGHDQYRRYKKVLKNRFFFLNKIRKKSNMCSWIGHHVGHDQLDIGLAPLLENFVLDQYI